MLTSDGLETRVFCCVKVEVPAFSSNVCQIRSSPSVLFIPSDLLPVVIGYLACTRLSAVKGCSNIGV